MPTEKPNPLRLHLGGEQPVDGWKILNISPGPNVDYVGSCTDLSQFANDTVSEIYASHVFEHLNYVELIQGFGECFRVLEPKGSLKLAVPDLDRLCELFLRRDLSLSERINLIKIFYGGQTNPFDFHKMGFNFEMLLAALKSAGFPMVERRATFGIFRDTSEVRYKGVPVSLNVETWKP